jgi:hypothetical protein
MRSIQVNSVAAADQLFQFNMCTKFAFTLLLRRDGLHPWHLRSKVIVNISPSFAVTIFAPLSSGHPNALITKVYIVSFGKREMTVFGRYVYSPL